MPMIKPLYLQNGLLKQSKAGDTLVIDSASLNTLLVSGKEVVLADGTLSSTGATATIINLQTAYNNTNVSGDAVINLQSGKDFKLINSVSESYLIFESDTGKLLISGDLEVAGSTTVVDSVVTNYDQLSITPSVPGITALTIEPDVGVSPALPLVKVKILNSGPDVFAILADGTTVLKDLTIGGNVTITGDINNIDIDTLTNNLNSHLLVSSNKHIASEINLNPSSYSIPGITQVQAAISSIDTRIIGNNTTLGTHNTRITTLENQVAAINSDSVVGYQHNQASPATTWTITHNKNNKRLVAQVYDNTDSLIYPNSINITENTVVIEFTTPATGTANIMFFTA